MGLERSHAQRSMWETNDPTPPAGGGGLTTYRRSLFLGGRFSFEALRAELTLEQRTAHMYGKDLLVPRLECWFGSRAYAFGGRVETPKPWTPLATELRVVLEQETGERFDSCFCNLYRDGNDSIAYHADDESWIGPVIASVSFGAERRFVLKHNESGERLEFFLGDGDLLVMLAGVQEAWKHAVPRTTKAVGPRLNLTFRQTLEGAWS